ncbi:hypothetical protein LINPERHAP1_LOCUS22651 [Linum perenne]
MILKQWSPSRIQTVACMLWSIWGERNQRVWEQKSRTTRLIVETGLTTQLEWEQARTTPNVNLGGAGPLTSTCSMWHNPPIGRLKCNMDAAFQEREQRWGCGMALRNHEGVVVSIRKSWSRGFPTVREGEALALLEALEWLENSGYNDVIIEVDSSSVAAAVMSHEDDETEFACKLVPENQLQTIISVCGFDT